MNAKSKLWIELGNKIIKNPFVKLECPHCKMIFLNILITPWPNEEQKVDIALFCEKCEERITITKNII